jgi:hypothetical protein
MEMKMTQGLCVSTVDPYIFEKFNSELPEMQRECRRKSSRILLAPFIKDDYHLSEFWPDFICAFSQIVKK